MRIRKIIPQKDVDNLTILFNKNAEIKNVQRINKTIKAKPFNLIVEAINNIENINNLIFILVASSELHSNMIFESLRFEVREKVIEKSTNPELKIIINNIFPDEIFYIIETHPNYEKKLLSSLDSYNKRKIYEIMEFEADTNGSLMNTELIKLNESWTVKHAIDMIKKDISNVQINTEFYIIDDEKKLVGSIRMNTLFFTDDHSLEISKLMATNIISVNAKDSIEDSISIFEKYSPESLPVCDDQNKLLGFISNEDVIDALQEEVTEDIYKMYGITQISTPYFHSTIWEIIKSRIFWLITLMIGATFTSIVIQQFQNHIDFALLATGITTAILIPILPVITGTTGNAGAQTSATVIRSLALGEITSKEYFKTIKKEFYIGIIIGFILAIVNFLRLSIFYAIFNEIPENANVFVDKWAFYNFNIGMSAMISLTLFISIIISKLIGSVLPILANKLNLDPASMSSPILATIADITSTTLLFASFLGFLSIWNML